MMRTNLVIKVIALITMLIFAFFLADWILYKTTIRREARRDTGNPFVDAQPIIEAIENYKIDNNSVPDSLSRIVPTYLSEISPPDWGVNAWYYNPGSDGKYFDLGVRLEKDNYTGHYYNSKRKIWWFDN